MKTFRDKVAVITGAASGIGRAIAERCVKEGIKVVLADIEEETLLETEKEMRAWGADALAVVTDVSKERDMTSLAWKTLDSFGAIHLLFNNAGVIGEVATIWKSSIADWEWVLGVNLWGVIHGVRIFVPIMIEQDTECHIVNTSSISGLTSGPGLGVYKVTKHGVVTLSETLCNELNRKGSKVKVSVLCPHWVNTRIVDSERNRPIESPKSSGEKKRVYRETKGHQEIRRAFEEGMHPSRVANVVFEAIKNETFYIFTHPESDSLIRLRTEDILKRRNPTNPLLQND